MRPALRSAPREGGEMRYAMLILACLALVGCEPIPPKKFERNEIASLVERVDDTERGVTCYVYRGYGISCVRRSGGAP